MALGFGPQTTLTPYTEDELATLQGLISPGQGALGAPPAPGLAPLAIPPPATALAVPAVTAPMPARPQPSGEPAPTPAWEPPPPPEPVRLPSAAPAATPPRGLATSGYAVDGVPDAERAKLLELHQQMSGRRLAAIDDSAKAESSILDKREVRDQQGVQKASAEQAAIEQRIAAEQAAREKLRTEGTEWAKRKEDPAKAFEGKEWAGVIGAIGIAAGVFAQAMGWQNGNPVLDAFNTHVERSLAAQREQKNSMLSDITARVGDSQAAENLMRAQLHDAIADRAEKELAVANTQEARERLTTLVTAEREKVQSEVVAAYERLVPKEQRSFARPDKPAAGPAPKTPLEIEKEIGELNLLWEKQGYTPEQRAERLKALGLEAPSGKSAEEFDREKAAAAATGTKEPGGDKIAATRAALKAFDIYGGKAGLRRDPRSGKWTVGDAIVSEATGRMATEKVASKVSLGLSSTPIANARDAAIEELGRLQSQGAIGEQERVAFEDRLDRALGGDLADVLNDLESITRLKGGTATADTRAAPSSWR